MGTKLWRYSQRGRSTGRAGTTHAGRRRCPAGLGACVLGFLGLLVWLALPATAWAQTPPAATVTTLAERMVTQLPAGTLVWRLK